MDLSQVSMKKEDVIGMWPAKLKEEEDVDFGNKKNETRRVCHICLKAFSSGKALGGHMRSHVQPINPSPSDCVICRKSFPSMKALFGHMRCHPDRDWRGIRPPPNKTDHDDPAEKERALDLTESLRRWPVTAKRGRKASSSDLDLDEGTGLHEAVNFLMMLAEGTRTKDLKKKKKKKKRKKVKLCDLNLLDDDRSNSIPICGKLLEFDLNEVPECW